MGCHLLIALSRHFERVIFGVLLNILRISNVMRLSGVLFSRGEYANNEVVLRITLVCIEGGICVLFSYLTLMGLWITLVRETPMEMRSLTHCKYFGMSLLWIHFISL